MDDRIGIKILAVNWCLVAMIIAFIIRMAVCIPLFLKYRKDSKEQEEQEKELRKRMLDKLKKEDKEGEKENDGDPLH